MPQISIHTPAPYFSLPNFLGQPVSLSDFRGKTHVMLVFNRGLA